MQISANAKINIGLKITGRLPNGYHTLEGLFLEVDLHDQLSIKENDLGRVRFTTDGLPIPGDGSNLCEQAADLIRKEAGRPHGVDIHLEKRIPIGAGLGGGSSDAAATLVALNHMWDLQFSTRKLIDLAVRLGADIPFFIQGGLQMAEGIGEILSPVPEAEFENKTILLIKPEFEVSTPWAYRELKNHLPQELKSPNFRALLEPINWLLFENDFERVILSTYPEVGEIKAELINQGAIFASLSGSGSTMFGIFDHKIYAENARLHFDAYETFVSHPVLHSHR